MNNRVRQMTQASVLAALYVVLTHACGEPYHGDDGFNDPAFVKLWSSPYFVESKKRCRAMAAISRGT